MNEVIANFQEETTSGEMTVPFGNRGWFNNAFNSDFK